MDENGYNFRLTVWFSDNDVVTEYFKTQRITNSAKRWWFQAAKDDGGYSIKKTEVEAL